MKKEEYIESLVEIINDDLFITAETNRIDEEVSKNCWSISSSQEIIDQLSIEELENVIDRIKENRIAQIAKSDTNVGMIFYLWFDGQANQLRFNLINENHKHLPFKCKVEFEKDISSILYTFLKSSYHNGIPMDELDEILPIEDASEDESAEMNSYVLKVFKEVFSK